MIFSIIIPVHSTIKVNILLDTLSVLEEELSHFHSPESVEIIPVVNGRDSRVLSAIVSFYALRNRNVLPLNLKQANRASARNRGLEKASGDFILFLDADTLLMPGWLSHCQAIFQDHAYVDFISGKIIPGKNGNFERRQYVNKNRVTQGQFLHRKTQNLPFLNSCALAWRRNNGKFRKKLFDEVLARNEDLEMSVHAVLEVGAIPYYSKDLECRKMDQPFFSTLLKKFYDGQSAKQIETKHGVTISEGLYFHPIHLLELFNSLQVTQEFLFKLIFQIGYSLTNVSSYSGDLVIPDLVVNKVFIWKSWWRLVIESGLCSVYSIRSGQWCSLNEVESDFFLDNFKKTSRPPPSETLRTANESLLSLLYFEQTSTKSL